MVSVKARLVCVAVATAFFSSGLALTGGAIVQATTASTVVINEVRCTGASPDFIELFNTSTTVRVDLTNWALADHLSNINDVYHVRMFPAGASIGPRMYLKIYRGTKTTEFKFDLTCGDDTVKLVQLVGPTVNVIDSVDIPPVASGFTWGRIATAVHGWSATNSSPGAANKIAAQGSPSDTSAWVFDPLLTKRIDLTLPAATMNTFQSSNPGDLYQPATFAVTAKDASGATVKSVSSMAIGMRLKYGYGSYRAFGTFANPGKSSFKLKFNMTVAGQRLDGLNKLTLNNMVQDASLVHEWASYTLFRAMGVPAPRVGYASVYINGKLWGFYLTLEPYDDISLSWNYPRTQHLYEALWTDRYPDITTGRANLAYEVDEGSTTSRTDLLALENAVNNYSMSSSQVQNVLNVQEMVTTMAVEQYLNHWDGYSSLMPWAPNNYYLHSDDDGVFELLPWGTDQTFGGNTGDYANANGVLFKRCMLDDKCKSMYQVAVANVATTASSLGLPAGITSILNVQRQGITDDTTRGLSFNDTVWQANGVNGHIVNATTQTASYLKGATTGEIRWTPSLTLKAGTKLTSSILNAFSDVPGIFTYSPALNTVTKVGNLKVKVTFKPTNSALNAVKTKQVTCVVVP
ncbi:MAG: CotH kinase family protein [Actinobacteria bacterium]|nr:CotH kinase family protein [Actinomycetota bacterium]